jgi:hypothetical protein
MTKYTIKQDQTHGTILCKNGMDAICPFQPAIPTQSQMGGLAIMRIPCSTSCVHAEHNKYNLAAGYMEEFVLTCTGTTINLELDQETETEAKIIKL